MARWTAFAGIAFLVVLLFLGLARASQSYVRESPPRDHDATDSDAERSLADGPPDDPDQGPTNAGDHRSIDASVPGEPSPSDADEPWTADLPDVDPLDGDRLAKGRAEANRHGGDRTEADRHGGDRTTADRLDGDPPDADRLGDDRPDAGQSAADPARRQPVSIEDLPYRVLLANVALSQAVFGVVLAFGIWYARIPLAALGVSAPTLSAIGVGAGLGIVLYLGNEAGAALADRVGIGHDERLRELLAPDSLAGWAGLLFVALPVVAGFEELLFRAVLVGAIPAGFGVSPWAMAVLSSVAFGVGHGAQGTAGVVVTGVLGFALAAAFVLTGSFVVVAVAHYLVNALEFVVHEGPQTR